MDSTKVNPLINTINPLSKAFIRIKNERTPVGNSFFRLDQLQAVYIDNNIGITPELVVSGNLIPVDVTYEQFMSFFATVIDSINKETNRIQIHELIITEETVRNIASRTEKSTTQ
ncbi:hypothetical protein [Yersinia kristensenii]|uniref:hypothetical protein n=1 Tax=Yersinia kristensenii TaxID=28152 RepID=UPI0005180798|nr:hypothetical protein [Yersinia kristensenii]PEH53127.1 hypothetical protein CRM81_07040 [Yersinia kristensenii]SUP71013.1 Uncharacterised protein [Yersinia kristensenii]